MRSPLKVILLDLDGVLNSRDWMAKGHPFTELDPAAVARLNRLIMFTEAKVVISSSWRLAFPMSQILAALQAAGFRGEIISQTPRRTTYPARRGNEIDDWLKAQRDLPNAFVILDDDSDIDPWKAFHVQTNPNRGLQDNDVEDAVKVLSTAISWAPAV